MAQFRGTTQGNRTEASRLGTKASGLYVNAASWEGAVDVRLWHDESNNVDMCEVALKPHVNGAGINAVLYCGPVGGVDCKGCDDAKVLPGAQLCRRCDDERLEAASRVNHFGVNVRADDGGTETISTHDTETQAVHESLGLPGSWADARDEEGCSLYIVTTADEVV